VALGVAELLLGREVIRDAAPPQVGARELLSLLAVALVVS
jgi:hypothetical protein